MLGRGDMREGMLFLAFNKVWTLPPALAQVISLRHHPAPGAGARYFGA